MKSKFDVWVDKIKDGFEEIQSVGKTVNTIRANEWTIDKLLEGFKMRRSSDVKDQDGLPEDCRGILWNAYLYEDDSLSDGEILLDY